MSRKERDRINRSGEATLRAMGMEADTRDVAFIDPSIERADGGVTQAGPHNVSPGRLADHYPEYRQDVAVDGKQVPGTGH